MVVITHDDRYLDELHLPLAGFVWTKVVSSVQHSVESG